MRAWEVQAGHSRLASLMLLQSRQRTAWFKEIVVDFIRAFMIVFLSMRTRGHLESFAVYHERGRSRLGRGGEQSRAVFWQGV